MPIHEENLIRPENLSTHENLVVDGVDVSGHWSTFIRSRVVKDYNENLQEEIEALPTTLGWVPTRKREHRSARGTRARRKSA